MKDRLIELIDGFDLQTIPNSSREWMEQFADHLIANGVIVPPVKVGQTVYVPWNWEGETGIATVDVEEIRIYDSQNHYMFFIDMESDDEDYNQAYGGWKIGKAIGKYVFLTKEEAEKALAESESVLGEYKFDEKIHTGPLDLSDAKFIDEDGNVTTPADWQDWNETPPWEESEGKE